MKINPFYIIFSVLIALLTLLACQQGDGDKAKQFRSRIGENVYTRIEKAHGVTAYLIKPQLNIDFNSTPEFLGEPIVLNEAQRNSFIKLLLNDQRYDFVFTKRSLFIPTLFIKYSDGESEGRIYINRKNNQIKFFDQGNAVLLDYDNSIEDFNQFYNSIGLGSQNG